jgi:hypothetical protein
VGVGLGLVHVTSHVAGRNQQRSPHARHRDWYAAGTQRRVPSRKVWHSDCEPHSLADVQVFPQESGLVQVTPQSELVEQIGCIPPHPSHASGKHLSPPLTEGRHFVPTAQPELEVHEFRQVVGFAHVIVHAA